MKGIADAGFIVFARRNDRHHPWALEAAKQITEPLLTCEAVLANLLSNWNPAPMSWRALKTKLRLAFDANRNLSELLESCPPLSGPQS